MRHAQRTVSLLSVLILLSMACSTLSVTATSTPMPPTHTATKAATETATVEPTLTPEPPTPTAAPVGFMVSNEYYEVEIIKIRKLGSVYLSEYYTWLANPGYLFLELGVKISGKRFGEKTLDWNDIYIIEQDKSQWNPNWGGYQTASFTEKLNPALIIFEELSQTSKPIVFVDTVYLRVIWTVKDLSPTTVYFGVENVPLLEVQID